MIGIIIISHGRLAEEFLDAMVHIHGAQGQIETLCMGPDDDVESQLENLMSLLKEVDSGDGVIMLADMFGGTPSNLAISVLNHGNYEVIAGVNLPMLVKLGSIRGGTDMKDAVEQAKEAGKHYISVASEVLKDK